MPSARATYVNACHSRLKNWMARFHGVATKYLVNYRGGDACWNATDNRSSPLTACTKRFDTLATRN